MSKKNSAAKPVKKSPPQKAPLGKADKLRDLKQKPKKVLPATNGKAASPKLEAKSEPISNFQKSKTGRELPATNGNLIINSISVDGETDFLILDASVRGNSLKRKGEDTYEAPVHSSLKNGLQAFAPHLLVLSNYCPAIKKGITDDDKPEVLLESIGDVPADLLAATTVTKIHLKHGKKHGFQIVGWIKTYRGKAQILTSPFENLDAPEETAYEFNPDAVEKINFLEERVAKYFSGEERGVIQSSLPFDDAPAEQPKQKTEEQIISGNEEVDVTDRY